MRTIQRTRQRLADAIVQPVSSDGGLQGLSRGASRAQIPDRIVACPADQQIALFEGIGEDEGLSQLLSVHNLTQPICQMSCAHATGPSLPRPDTLEVCVSQSP